MHVRQVGFALAVMMTCGGAEMASAAAREEDATVEAPAAREQRRSVTPPVAQGIPYARAFRASVHNAYDRDEPLLDQLVYHHVRSLELDIHPTREGTAAPSGDWFVYHEDIPFLRSTSCVRFSDCLGQLAAFHRAVPDHDVVTVFVDLKDDFTEHHRPADLDHALGRILGEEALVTPAKIRQACPAASSLRAALDGGCPGATTEALRGRFLVAVTGGTACDPSSRISQYLTGGGDRIAFAAPNAGKSCPVARYAERPEIAFLNLPYAERRRTTDARVEGFVTRIYGSALGGGLDTREEFAAARAIGATHVATDRVNPGFGRAAIFTGEPDGDSDRGVLAIAATSGDQWGASDGAVLAYETDPSDATYRALVSVPSSHVEAFAKACLVARASTAPDAASVALCRPFDGHPARVQYRAARGSATTAVEAPEIDGLTDETPAFLRLQVRSGEVLADVSADGLRWVRITTTITTTPLPVRGIAVSSHGPRPVTGLFAALTRSRPADPAPVALASLEEAHLGGATGSVVVR